MKKYSAEKNPVMLSSWQFFVIVSSIVLKESGYFGIQALVALVLACIGIYTMNKSTVKNID